MKTTDWLGTQAMADEVGVSRATLQRLMVDGFLLPGKHFQRVNPTKPKSKLLWNVTRTKIKLGRV